MTDFWPKRTIHDPKISFKTDACASAGFIIDIKRKRVSCLQKCVHASNSTIQYLTILNILINHILFNFLHYKLILDQNKQFTNPCFKIDPYAFDEFAIDWNKKQVNNPIIHTLTVMTHWRKKTPRNSGRKKAWTLTPSSAVIFLLFFTFSGRSFWTLSLLAKDPNSSSNSLQDSRSIRRSSFSSQPCILLLASS